MTDNLFSVADKVTLVSGASRGIGRAIAQGFAERGARVIVTGRDPETIEKTASEICDSINADTASVRPIVCDVANIDSIRNLVDSVIEEYGRIDTLLNVAGVNKRQPVESFTVEEYDFILGNGD